MYKAVEQFMSSMSVMSVCWIKKSPNTGLYIQSSLVNKTRLWAKTGNWHSRRITDFTQITPQREMLSPLSLLDIRSSSCLCIPEELWILPDFHPCQQTTYSVNAALIRRGLGLHWGECSSVRGLTTLHPTVGRIHSPHGTTGLKMTPFSRFLLRLYCTLSITERKCKLLYTSLGFGIRLWLTPSKKKKKISVTDCIKTDSVVSDKTIVYWANWFFKFYIVFFVNKAHYTQIRDHWPKNIYAY